MADRNRSIATWSVAGEVDGYELGGDLVGLKFVKDSKMLDEIVFSTEGVLPAIVATLSTWESGRILKAFDVTLENVELGEFLSALALVWQLPCNAVAGRMGEVLMSPDCGLGLED